MAPKKPKPKLPRAPVGLQDAGREYWRAVHSSFVVEEHHTDLLTAACRQLDRAAEARKSIEKDGVQINDRFGVPKMSPAVEIERQAHGMFLKLSRELGLDVVVPESRGHRRAGTGY